MRAHKILAAVLSLIMALSVFPFGMLAALAETEGIFNYSISNAEATITGFADSNTSGAIEIPSTIGGYPVTSIGDSAFKNCTGLTGVTIPDSVTSIGRYAFAYCTSLKKITIPASVTQIGYEAFSRCSSFKTAGPIGGGYGYEFGWTDEIPDNAFLACPRLKTVKIPDGVTSIGKNAFYSCTALTSITIPNTVTSIGDTAFERCEGLTSITIPGSVTTIGDSAFRDCTSLTSVTVPNSVTTMVSYPFYNCTALKTAGPIGGGYDYEFGWTDTIPDHAFAYCIGLTSVDIPDSVTSIGDYAFYNCKGLTSIVIPNGVTSIDDYAFSYCTGLTSITIPDGTKTIGCSAFEKSTALSDIIIPDSVTEVEIKAFNNTAWYNNQPDGLIYAGKVAYKYKGDCPSSVEIKDGVISITGEAFKNCKTLTNVIVPDSVTSIGSDAFYKTDWYNNQPDGLVYAGKVAYKYKGNCPSSVEINDGTIAIADEAFNHSINFSSVIIPVSVKSIGESAFDDCPNFTDIYYSGTKQDRTDMTIDDKRNGNRYLLNATWHYTADPESYIPGDINNDGKVNNKDLTRLFQHLSSWEVEVNELALDVNGDGKQNNKDLTRLFQYLSGWDVEIH